MVALRVTFSVFCVMCFVTKINGFGFIKFMGDVKQSIGDTFDNFIDSTQEPILTEERIVEVTEKMVDGRNEEELIIENNEDENGDNVEDPSLRQVTPSGRTVFKVPCKAGMRADRNGKCQKIV